MYGLEAISQYNGWAMAFTGAVIVMIGLVVLSTCISQLHKILAFVDQIFKGRPAPAESLAELLTEETGEEDPVAWPLDGERAAARLVKLSTALGGEFQLSQLYRVCNENNIAHPHLTIRNLRESGLLLPLGDGLFTWKD